MRYLPHTPQEIEQMLAVTGHTDLNQLFDTILRCCKNNHRIKPAGPVERMGFK